MGKAVEFIGINKRFPGAHVLKDISFSVEEGEVHALLGENGAGKSTLLNILHGVYTEYEGTVKLHGKEVRFKNVNDAIVSGKISKVHQETLVVKDLTVGQNVTLGYEPKKGTFVDFGKMYADVNEILNKLHCKFKSEDLVATLTSGEMQMLAIARALMTGPKVLLLDEPSMGLSPLMTQEVFKVLRHLKDEGTTIFLIEQNAYEDLELTDRAYIMESGRISLEGRSSELLNDERVKNAYLGGDV